MLKLELRYGEKTNVADENFKEVKVLVKWWIKLKKLANDALPSCFLACWFLSAGLIIALVKNALLVWISIFRFLFRLL